MILSKILSGRDHELIPPFPAVLYLSKFANNEHRNYTSYIERYIRKGVNTMEKNIRNNSCFIITPIGEETSDDRRKAEGVIQSVIKPILEELGFKKIDAAHEISESGSITKQVINRIIEDDLVITNLTGLNPNVMYELAIRHATMKPVVHICEKETKLPFDIIDQRTIFYNNDMLGVKELEVKLKEYIQNSLEIKENRNNPIYNSVEYNIFQNVAINEPEKKFEGYILKRLDKIDEKISKVIDSDIVTRDKHKNIIYDLKEYYIDLNISGEFNKAQLHYQINQKINEIFLSLESIEIYSNKNEVASARLKISTLPSYKMEYLNEDQVQRILNEIKDFKFNIYQIKNIETTYQDYSRV